MIFEIRSVNQTANELRESEVSMIEGYRTECGRPTWATPATERARQTTSDLGSETRRVTNHSERHPTKQERATSPPPHETSRLNWEMLVIWSFVVFSFAALFFAGYVIWAKCQVR